jgi:hypothetical protein
MPPIGGYISQVGTRVPSEPIYQDGMKISKEDLTELTELIEDSVEYYCDQHRISGQLAWTIVESLGTAKLAELKGELAAV